MPISQIYLMEARTVEQKRKLIEKITDAMNESIGAPRESVRVIITEMPKEHFGIGGKSAAELGR